jgi:hypothetical protein
MEFDKCIAGSRQNGKYCSRKEIAYLQKFRTLMWRSIDGGLNSHSAYWLVSCGYHTIANHDYSWNVTLADSRTLRDTLLGWYNALVVERKRGRSSISFRRKDFLAIGGEYDFEESMEC